MHNHYLLCYESLTAHHRSRKPLWTLGHCIYCNHCSSGEPRANKPVIILRVCFEFRNFRLLNCLPPQVKSAQPDMQYKHITGGMDNLWSHTFPKKSDCANVILTNPVGNWTRLTDFFLTTSNRYTRATSIMDAYYAKRMMSYIPYWRFLSLVERCQALLFEISLLVTFWEKHWIMA